MKTMHARILLVAVCALLLSSCTRAPVHVRSGSSELIEPLDGRRGSTGFLIATVQGTPRDIQYFINGVQIEPEEEVKWWKDARIELELRPGFYNVEAVYFVRAFAGEGQRYRVATQQPVEVRPGRRTQITAEILKDWRGVPEQETTYFRLHGGSETEDTNQRDWDSGQAIEARPDRVQEGIAALDEDALGPRPASKSSRLDSTGPDEIIVHGGADGGEAIVRIQRSGGLLDESVDDIVIRGENAIPFPPTAPESAVEGEVVDASGTSLVGLPGPAEPSHEDLPAPEDATAPLEDWVEVEAPTPSSENTGASITVLIQSDPSGALVSIDGHRLGKTPLRVRVNPTSDHVLLFEREDCGDYVRLLSASGWQRGRSPSVLVQLQCD